MKSGERRVITSVASVDYWVGLDGEREIRFEKPVAEIRIEGDKMRIRAYERIEVDNLREERKIGAGECYAIKIPYSRMRIGYKSGEEKVHIAVTEL